MTWKRIRFGSTYEGLKLHLRAHEERRVLGFGSTYEGLKQPLRRGSGKGIDVFWQYL